MAVANDAFRLSEIAADLAAHALDNKEHLFMKTLNPGLHESRAGGVKSIDAYMASMEATDEVVFTEMFFNEISQPGQKDTFDPKNNLVGFKTRRGKVRPIKADAKFLQTKMTSLVKSYLGQVKGLKVDPTVLPFEAQIIDGFLNQVQIDLRKMLWHGVYNPTGTSVNDTFDGLLKQVLEAISVGDIPSGNIIDTNAITSLNAVVEFEKIMAGIPSNYFYGDLVCVTNRKLMNAYATNYRKEFGLVSYNAQYDKPMLEGSNIEFIVEPNLDGFDRPLFLPKNNIVYLYDTASSNTNFDVFYNKETRSISMMMDYQAAVGIAVAELLWTNDGV